MIALLIGGVVVLCVGLLTIVFGVPIKEFSFGNTMIVAGTVVSCTGLLLIGLYFVSRELKALVRRLEAGIPAAPAFAGSREATDLVDVIRSSKSAPEPVPSAPIGSSGRDDMLFSRDRSRAKDGFADRLPQEPFPAPRTAAPASEDESPEPWQEEHAHSRNSGTEASDAASLSAQRQQRRNLLFSSRRREQTPREVEVRDETLAEQNPPHQQSSEDPTGEETGHRSNSEPGSLFETAWPQRERPRREPSPLRSRLSRTSNSEGSEPESPRERYQPPKRAETESVTVVKSGVVDSMAYSLYSDGSIEAQMPEGMVRFASIEELRAHLDQRG
jgi:hypothetical protein